MAKTSPDPRGFDPRGPDGRPAEPAPPPEVGAPRRPTDPEWLQLSGWFPLLVRDDVWITAEPTATYNCIAWSLHFTDRWINPPQPLANFDQLYVDFGYQLTVAHAADALIDGWATGAALALDMTHASRLYQDAGPLWESKLGQSWRITHGRDQLDTPALYGTVVTSFDQPLLARSEPLARPPMKSLTTEELSQLAQQVSRVPPTLRAEFDVRYQAWRATWNPARSDTRGHARGGEFDRLVELGEAIVPLVIERMVRADEFAALVLYDRLAPDPSLVIRYRLRDPDRDEGEQSRALRSARLWLRR